MDHTFECDPAENVHVSPAGQPAESIPDDIDSPPAMPPAGGDRRSVG